MSIFGLAECLCPDMACVILVACHTAVMAVVLVTVEARHRGKLAQMERIALEALKENARLRGSHEIRLPEMQTASDGNARNTGETTDAMPHLRADHTPAGSGAGDA